MEVSSQVFLLGGVTHSLYPTASPKKRPPAASDRDVNQVVHCLPPSLPSQSPGSLNNVMHGILPAIGTLIPAHQFANVSAIPPGAEEEADGQPAEQRRADDR